MLTLRLMRLLHRSGPAFSSGDWGTAILLAIAVCLPIAALPALAHQWDLVHFPPGRIRIFVTVGFAVLGIVLSLGALFKNKVMLELFEDHLRVFYPFRLRRRQWILPYAQLAYLRFGEEKQHFWMSVYLKPQPGRPDQYEDRLDLGEEQLLITARELEAMGVDVAVYMD
jgi:hypothetical protein